MAYRSKLRIDNVGRQCSRCGVFKQWSEFTKNKHGTRGYQSWCRDCFQEHSGKRKKKEYLITGDGRECSRCGIFKTWENFHRRGDVSTGYMSACKHCIKKKSQTDAEQGKIRNAELKRKYNITLDEYYELLGTQGGKCAICDATETSTRQIFLSVDHNHDTGEIRGLLCQKCNSLLGMANDDPAVLYSAIEYLCRMR